MLGKQLIRSNPCCRRAIRLRETDGATVVVRGFISDIYNHQKTLGVERWGGGGVDGN